MWNHPDMKTTWDEDGMWQLSDSFSDEKNHKAVSHPAVLLMPIKLNYPLLAQGCVSR